MGPMLWDLDEQFPGSIGGIGGSAAVECGFLPFRFRRKKIGKWSDRPTDRPTDRVLASSVCTQKREGEGSIAQQ